MNQPSKSFLHLSELWDRAPSPAVWHNSTTPAETLLYAAGHPHQVKDLLALEHLLDSPVRVIGHHSSKSVGLPVGMFRMSVKDSTILFITRNNFYNVKLVVVATCPIFLPYDKVHRRLSAEQYAAEKAKAYDYCKKHTDFDPAKYESDDWLKDWSGDSILRAGDEIYRCGTTSSCYYEGMSRSGVPEAAFQRYEQGRTEFAVEIDGGTIEMLVLMQDIKRSVEDAFWERRKIEDARQRYNSLRTWPTPLGDYQKKELAEVTNLLRQKGILD